MKTYLVYPDWTLNQFRDALKPLVAIDFTMDPDIFEFVLCLFYKVIGLLDIFF